MTSQPDTRRSDGPDLSGLSDPVVRRIAQDITVSAVIGCSPEGRICFWNRGAERLLSHAADEVLGVALADILRTAGQRAWARAVLAPDRAAPGPHLATLPRRDGTPRTYLVTVERDARFDDQPATYLVLTPAGGPRSARDEAQAPTSAGHRQLDALGQLAGGIAHDFNNLLLGMIGHADLLLLELPPNSPQRAHVEEIAQGGLRAADLCRQLQAIGGNGVSGTESIDLSQLVRNTAPLVGFSLGAVDLRLELTEDLPPVAGDETQLRQVLLNLITNASEALREREDARIIIRTLVHDGTADPLRDPVTETALPGGLYAVVEVQDNGPGMSGDQVARAFQPFFTTKFAGRGLGLASGLGTVRAHGGSIELCSRPSLGTTVTVALPIRGVAHPAVVDATSAEPRSIVRETPRVLVVDDEDDIRTIARGILDRAGYLAEAAEHGGQALSIFDADPGAFDLVLLDITMPGLDGLEVLARIREKRTELPVILSSGHAPEMCATTVADDPHCRFLPKPYRREELLAIAADLLDVASD